MSDQLKQAARQALEAMRLNRSSAVVDAMLALEAALSEPEPEAVAVIGDTFSLLWASGDAISDIAKRHGLKVGSKLYAAPQPPAQAEPCDMGPICIGCEPRGPRGECPGARAEVWGDEPVAAQCRFRGESQWGWCSVEHHKAVQANPQDWPNYETRLVYPLPAPAAPQATIGGEDAALILLKLRSLDAAMGGDTEGVLSEVIDSAISIVASQPMSHAAPQAGEADSNFVWTMCKFIDYATGGRASKENTPLPVLKSLVDEHISELIDEATEEASQPMSREGMSEPLPEHADHVSEIAARLRLVAKLAGCPQVVPDDDRTAVGAIFSVLGDMRRAMERAHGIGSGEGSGSGEGVA